MIWKTHRVYKNDKGGIEEVPIHIFIDEDFKVATVEAAYGFDLQKYCSINTSVTGEIIIRSNHEDARHTLSHALLNKSMLPIDKEL